MPLRERLGAATTGAEDAPAGVGLVACTWPLSGCTFRFVATPVSLPSDQPRAATEDGRSHMFGFLKDDAAPDGPRVSTKFCTLKFNGRYPHVGLYDCRERKVWVAKPLNGQAIRTSHARLITGADNATSTVWKDRFLCFWFYTPRTGEGYIHGYPIDWDEAHLLVRIDPHWDYDRQRMIPPELEDQVDENLERQHRHGERIFEYFHSCRLTYPFSLHLIGQRATDSLFYVKRVEAAR